MKLRTIERSVTPADFFAKFRQSAILSFFRAAIASAAGDRRAAANGKLNAAIEKARASRQVKGFQREHAPAPMYAPDLIQRSRRSPDLLNAVLIVWVNARPQLYDSVHAFLTAQPEQSYGLTPRTPKMNVDAFVAFAKAECAATMATAGQPNEDEIELMLYLSSGPPVPIASTESAQGFAESTAGNQSTGLNEAVIVEIERADNGEGLETSELRPDSLDILCSEQRHACGPATILSAIEAELKNLAPDDPEWQAIAAVVSSLEQLVSAKNQERDRLISIRRTLADLVARHADLLRAFPDDLSLLHPLDFTPEDRAAALDLLERLGPLLVQYRECLNSPPPAFVQLRRQKREYESSIEGAITALLLDLSQLRKLPVSVTEIAPEVAREMAVSNEFGGDNREEVNCDGGESDLCCPPALSIQRATAPEALDLDVSVDAVRCEVSKHGVHLQSHDYADDEVDSSPDSSSRVRNVIPGLALDRGLAPLNKVVNEIPSPTGEAGPVGWVKEVQKSDFSGTTALEPTVNENSWGEPESTIGISVAGREDPLHHVSSHASCSSQSEARERLLSELLFRGDLPCTLLLLDHEHSKGQDVSPPLFLLTAVAKSQIIRAPGAAALEDAGEVCVANEPEDTEFDRLMGLAASLKVSVLAPACGIAEWLVPPAGYPALHHLVNVIRDFASRNVVPDASDFAMMATMAQLSESEACAARNAAQWLEDASKTTSINDSFAVERWKNLINPGEKIHVLLSAAATNSRDTARATLAALAEWEDNPAKVLKEQQYSRNKASGAYGDKWLLRQIEDACRQVRLWCAASEARHDAELALTYSAKTLLSLREGLAVQVPPAVAELELRGIGPACLETAARGLVRNTILDLARLSHLPAAISTQGQLLADVDPPQTLDGAVELTLLMFPKLDRGEDDTPDLSGLFALLEHYVTAGLSTEQVLDAWLTKEDYKSLLSLCDSLANECLAQTWRDRALGLLADARTRLKGEIEALQEEIEQAYLDGYIEEEGPDLRAELLSPQPSLTQQFSPVRAKLDRIRTLLSEAGNRHVRLMKDRAEELYERMRGSSDEAADSSRVTALISNALANRNLRAAEELIVEAGRRLTNGVGLAQFVPEGAPEDEFSSPLNKFRQFLSEQSTAQERHAPRKAPFEDGELEKAARAWSQLSQLRSSSRNEIIRPVQELCQFLGFRLSAGTGERPAAIRGYGPAWTFLELPVSGPAGEVRPFWEFGSQQPRLRVLCIWPNEKKLSGLDWVRDLIYDESLERAGVVVFYLSTLFERERFVRADQERGDWKLSIAVLDEHLFEFLLAAKGTRLPTFLRCSLPFASPCPYITHGPVPPEMFFGRRDMVTALQRFPGGRSIVFGGRQLGKSAVLEQVRLQFHKPELDQYAWVRDVKELFNPQEKNSAEGIWRHLLDDFKLVNLIRPSVSTNKYEEVRKHVIDAMRQSPDRKVLVLLDEVDNLFRVDSQEGFSVISRLRALMAETNNSLRFVFAGLADVARFQGIPNLPLAQFGEQVNVGPMEPGDALRLVTMPFLAVGAVFAEQSDPLLILSYTNYHTGLIQYFCHELLEHVMNRNAYAFPPYVVRRADIEYVYRKQAVRGQLLDRFNLTLELDPRYQVIAWTMIENQLKDAAAFGRTYRKSDLFSAAKYWWPAGFDSMPDEQAQGLLNEMCGLGVLSRDSTGQYRLRSANLVRLMGDGRDVEDKLLALQDKPAQTPLALESLHGSVLHGQGSGGYSPLLYSQERQMNQAGFGVVLLFASHSNGWTSLPQALERLRLAAEDEVQQVPAECGAPRELQSWLTRNRSAFAKSGRVILYHVLSGGDPQIGEVVRAGLDFCRLHQTRTGSQTVKLIFLLDSAATQQWLRLPEDERVALEARSTAVLSVRRWDLAGLRQRLGDGNYVNSDEATRSLYESTGGWHFLVDEAFRLLKNKGVPQEAADALRKKWSLPSSELRSDLKKHLRIDEINEARIVLEFLMLEEGFEVEQLNPDLLAHIGSITSEEIRRGVLYLQRLDCLVWDDKRTRNAKLHPMLVDVFRR